MLHIRPLSRGGIHSLADDSSLQTAKHSETVSQKFPLDFCCETSPSPVIHPESVSQMFPAEIWQVSFTHTCNPARKLHESLKNKGSNGKSISPTQLQRSKLLIFHAVNTKIA